MAHMKTLYPDWRAPGLTVCLHEHVGGFAFNMESMHGLADLGRKAGASIIEGVEVTGFVRDGSGAVTSVQTSAGEIAIGKEVVVAVGHDGGALQRHGGELRGVEEIGAREVAVAAGLGRATPSTRAARGARPRRA